LWEEQDGRLCILLSKSMSGVSAFQRVDVKNLVIFQGRVQLGLKDISCSAALRMYTGDRATTIKFNDSYCVFSCTLRIELLRGERIRKVAKS
jgi:hypothetical protein